MKKLILLLSLLFSVSLPLTANANESLVRNEAILDNDLIYVKVNINDKIYIFVYLSDGITLVYVYEEED